MVTRCVRLGVERAKEEVEARVRGERRLRGTLEDLTAWLVGPRPVYGRHRASMRRPRPETGRPPSLLKL
jgi:hypothetical protein